MGALVMTHIARFGLISAIALTSAMLPTGAVEAADYKVLGTFDASTGPMPTWGLADVNGVFYGVTPGARKTPNGTVVAIAAHHPATLVTGFGGSGGPVEPSGPLLNSDGTLWGVSFKGGASGTGTIFTVTPSRSVTVVHSFGDGKDGYNPVGSLINVNGTFYGAAYGGDGGVVFSVTPDGTYTRLSHFILRHGGVAGPIGGLVSFRGRFYGIAALGGINFQGGIYSVDLKGKSKTIYTFSGGADGTASPGALTVLNGMLYGTTLNGGSAGLGNVFSLTTAGSYTNVYSFQGGTDGATPQFGVVASGGVLYGTTSSGGGTGCGTGCGTVYSLTPGGAETVLYRFAGGKTDGATPSSALLAGGRYFYGVTSAGGRHDDGIAFQVGK